MKKNIMTSICFVLALALVVISLQISSTASVSYIAVAIGLMAAYCVSQYRYGKNYR